MLDENAVGFSVLGWCARLMHDWNGNKLVSKNAVKFFEKK
jgi:hypothetical protein